jgi:hypothetical protein
MNDVVQADRVHVLQRLRDLRDWARFIHESLKSDQPFETGKRMLLEAYMGEGFLRDFDQDSARLAERLDEMIERIESSAVPAEQAAICTR